MDLHKRVELAHSVHETLSSRGTSGGGGGGNRPQSLVAAVANGSGAHMSTTEEVQLPTHRQGRFGEEGGFRLQASDWTT
jgi:hypothetical protein